MPERSRLQCPAPSPYRPRNRYRRFPSNVVVEEFHYRCFVSNMVVEKFVIGELETSPRCCGLS